jgi:hypothetical protein
MREPTYLYVSGAVSGAASEACDVEREAADAGAPVTLAAEVAEAETLIRDGVVSAEETAGMPVSGALHGRVLLALAERDDVRTAGLTLAEACAWARAVAVVVERVRIGAAFLAETFAA